MRFGRAICVALGLCLVGSFVIGCDSGSSTADKAAGTQPAIQVPPDAKKWKSKATGKLETRADRMPHL